MGRRKTFYSTKSSIFKDLLFCLCFLSYLSAFFCICRMSNNKKNESKNRRKSFSTSIQLCAGCYYYVRWLENPSNSTIFPIDKRSHHRAKLQLLGNHLTPFYHVASLVLKIMSPWSPYSQHLDVCWSGRFSSKKLIQIFYLLNFMTHSTMTFCCHFFYL